ncbi:hypothetical protein Sm713_60920 [Streptomyces sp. TS71-3]|nr:hypothetical protein Sm713_60920 [Streptomyces sp. TS71-3]
MGATKAQRIMIVAGAALVATVAMAASADTLASLGRSVGWGPGLAWSLPVSVDVLALVAGLAWLAAGASQSLGRVLTLITVGVSVLLNAVGHLVSTGHLTTGPILVIAVSAVPPLAAALAVHLGATVNTDQTAFPAETAAPLGTTVSASPRTPDADKALLDKRTTRDQPPWVDSPSGPADQAGPEGQVRTSIWGEMGAQDRLRTTDHKRGPAPADHTFEAPAQRTEPAPGHADQPADQAAGPGPQKAGLQQRTSNAAGQAAIAPSHLADHKRAEQAGGPADVPQPLPQDQGAPADHVPVQNQPRVANHATRTTGKVGASVSADHGIQAPDQQTTPAPDHAGQPDHDGIPQEAIEVARAAALAEGRMTRRAIRPHLREHGIKVSNELFSHLQAHLHTDPGLAHLPRTPRKTR